MSRGGRNIADVVELAWKNGAKFDAWTEFFNEAAWKGAADAVGIDLQALAAKEFSFDEKLPWEHIGCGVDKSFLLEEWKRACKGATTSDCTSKEKNCEKCAVCWNLGCKNCVQGERRY